ncbi:hypothetical protein R4Z10_12560 [Niallia sp. XMNu-256]|uniref:hypothetical protein n=1 Tax=Niallia sp. XMNu-256 TaxID=3082444 RepID=UPI0030CE53FB
MKWRCIAIYGVLIFLIILFLAASLNFRTIKNKLKPIPAGVKDTQSSPENQFKEEMAMGNDKEKEFKERAKSAELAKIERVAAAKAEEEIASELAPLKDQLKEIQSTLKNFGANEQQSNKQSSEQESLQPNQLLKQMQSFSSQAQQQQQKTFQQLQQSIQQTAKMLSNVEQSLQSMNMLNQITDQLTQSQQALQQQLQGQSSQQGNNWE